MSIPVGATHKLRGEFYREDFDSWHRLFEGKWVAVPQASWDWVTRHAAPITGAMRQAVAAAVAQAENPLITALRGCINVMERDLNGLAVIQPELKQAREALAAAEAQPEPWSGEGLPPVGTDVEVIGLGDEYRPKSIEDWKDGDKVECVAHRALQGEHVSPVFFNKRTMQFSSLRKDCYRPIRTPEQIAAEKLEQDAIALFSALNPDSKWHKASEENKDRYRAAVEAGYRKQVAP